MTPTLQSVWLVDSADRDPTTGKVNVLGMFDCIDVPAGSEYAAGATLFFAVRGVHGRADLDLLYVDLATDEVLVERAVRVDGDPLDATDVTVRMSRIPTPHAGEFAWELQCDGEPLGSCRVRVTVTGRDEDVP